MARNPAATAFSCVASLQTVSWAVWVFTAPALELARRIPDDSYYYATIGRSLSEGLGPTSDGTTMTNGYQPLWQFLVAGMNLVSSGTATIRLMLLVGAAFTLGGYLLLVTVTRSVVRVRASGIALGAVVVTAPIAWSPTVNGMEASLVALTLALVAFAGLMWWRRATTWTALGVGVACGLFCLARVSGTFTVLAVPVLYCWARNRTGDRVAPLQFLATATAGILTVTLPWFVWSWAVVGSPWSVAGMVKSNWERRNTGPALSAAGLRAARFATANDFWRLLSASTPFPDQWPTPMRRLFEGLALAATPWAAVRLLLRRPASVVVIAPVLALAARVTLEILLLPTMRASWYSAPLFTVLGLVVAVVWTVSADQASAMVRRRRLHLDGAHLAVMRALAACAALLLGLTLSLDPRSNQPNWGQGNWEASQQLRSTAKSERIGSFDSGLLGWERPGVINLDGLVRDPDYADRASTTDELADVVLAEGLDLLVGRFEPGDSRLPACAVPVWRSAAVAEVNGKREPVRIWDLGSCPT